MATVTGTLQALSNGIVVVTWPSMGDADVGSSVEVPGWADRTAQAIGDATGIAIEGSNDGTHWFSLTDPSGTTIALAGSSNDMAFVVENPRYMRPVADGGTDTTVIIVGYTER
jgi:hypothetical protein